MHDDCLNVNQQLENLSRKFVKRIGLLRHITPYLIERLRYPGSVYGYEQCHLVLLMSVIRSYFFCFLAIDNDIMRKMFTLITSKGTTVHRRKYC